VSLSATSVSELPPHHLAVALLQPQIAPNTGNIARLCVASSCDLHLVRPLGFVLSDRSLRRSAMDYWPRLKLTVHDDIEAFLAAMGERRCWLFDSEAKNSLFDVSFGAGDVLVFGSETRGIDPALLHARSAHSIRIPQSPNERCLNVSTAAGIAVYEALRQIHASLSGPKG
jgi:tRNA (cytidine/uridine-2'-O-)-methyltransferase